MERITSERAHELKQQSQERDKAEIKINEIANGILVKIGAAWFAYEAWPEACDAIGAELSRRRRERGDNNVR